MNFYMYLIKRKILNSLKEGNKLVFIRHAIAPGNGDPNNFDIKWSWVKAHSSNKLNNEVDLIAREAANS